MENKHIENVVIGKPLCSEYLFFAYDEEDWEKIEKDKTVWTEEKYLPRILVEYKFMKSINEIKRNRPDLCVILNKLDFLKIKIGKKFLYIVVGE